MSERAIITVQVGHYSNHVGAHFWNAQEANFAFDEEAARRPQNDLDHTVLYREGRTINR